MTFYVENLLSQNCNVFSVLSIFNCNQMHRQSKWQICHLSIISIRWYRTDVLKKSSDGRIIIYGLVTRYGPQSVGSGKWLRSPRLVAGGFYVSSWKLVSFRPVFYPFRKFPPSRNFLLSTGIEIFSLNGAGARNFKTLNDARRSGNDTSRRETCRPVTGDANLIKKI